MADLPDYVPVGDVCDIEGPAVWMQFGTDVLLVVYDDGTEKRIPLSDHGWIKLADLER